MENDDEHFARVHFAISILRARKRSRGASTPSPDLSPYVPGSGPTRDELEDDILFQNVLIESLDSSADDYEEALAKFEASKGELERQLNALPTLTHNQTTFTTSPQRPPVVDLTADDSDD